MTPRPVIQPTLRHRSRIPVVCKYIVQIAVISMMGFGLLACGSTESIEVAGNVEGQPPLSPPVPEQWIPSGDEISVIEATVTTALEAGEWIGRGMVANGSSEDAAVEVHAVLLDANDVELADVSVHTAVPIVEAGGSVPFEITAADLAAPVVAVRWSISVEDPSTVDGQGLAPRVFWVRPIDDPRPVDHYLYRDIPGEDPAHVLVGTVENTGSTTVRGVEVVATFHDGSGRIVDVVYSTVVVPTLADDLDGESPIVDRSIVDERGESLVGDPLGDSAAEEEAVVLDPRGAADVLVVVRATDAPTGLEATSPTLWAWSE